jgi:hypothetical protein
MARILTQAELFKIKQPHAVYGFTSEIDSQSSTCIIETMHLHLDGDFTPPGRLSAEPLFQQLQSKALYSGTA